MFGSSKAQWYRSCPPLGGYGLKAWGSSRVIVVVRGAEPWDDAAEAITPKPRITEHTTTEASVRITLDRCNIGATTPPYDGRAADGRRGSHERQLSGVNRQLLSAPCDYGVTRRYAASCTRTSSTRLPIARLTS